MTMNENIEIRKLKKELEDYQNLFNAMDKTLSFAYKKNEKYRKEIKNLKKFITLNELDKDYEEWLKLR